MAAGGGDAAWLPLPRALLPPPPPRRPGPRRPRAGARREAPPRHGSRVSARGPVRPPDNMEAAPPRPARPPPPLLLLLALCCGLAPATGRWTPGWAGQGRADNGRAARAAREATWESWGASWDARRGHPLPIRRLHPVTDRPQSARGAFVSAAPASPAPPGAARAGPHLPASRGALGTAPRGRPRSVHTGPGLWGMRAPRSESSSREKVGSAGPPGLWRLPL